MILGLQLLWSCSDFSSCQRSFFAATVIVTSGLAFGSIGKLGFLEDLPRHFKFFAIVAITFVITDLVITAIEMHYLQQRL